MELDTRALLNTLLACFTADATRESLSTLGDFESATINQAFGPHNLKWAPFGDNPSNISTIGLATKPGKSLSERITNAIDALLEERAQRQTSPLPQSPRDAAAAWFGRPASGPDTGLFQGISVPTDKLISLVLLPSGQEDSPTVDVIDQGVGIPPEQLKTTILSLQAGNKITKRHQIGAFGQGGSSTLGFSEYVIVASRHYAAPTKISFTVIRVLKLDASYKEDCYAYLTDSTGLPLVASVDADKGIDLYNEMGETIPAALVHGTLVRHIAYRLGSISKALGPSPGNLYHYLHYTLFDPILPFRVWDLRSDGAGRNEYVGGSRNRLMRILGKGEDNAGNVQVRHHRSMEFVVPSGADMPCVGIEYWVVLAFRKKGEQESALRANSAELFVQSGHPIVGTLNGQTQGELTGLTLKAVGLGLLSRHIVVHIDASAADSRVRRELFSTSREGFKDGPVLESLTATLKRMLEEDQELAAIEAELTERLARRDAATTRDEVRQQVTRLLKEAGLQVSEKSQSDIQGTGQLRTVARQKRKIYTKPDPLPTQTFPHVTYLKIVSPRPQLNISLQDSELILIETDADNEFDRRGMIGIRSSDDTLKIESRSPLMGGRMRWRLRPADEVLVGSVGNVTVSLTKPNGEQLTDSIPFVVHPPKEKPSKKGATIVPPFEIEQISPDQEEKWDFLWPDDAGDEARQSEHAYKAHEHGGKTWVYYSIAFPPYLRTLERLKETQPELVQAFTTAYEVWIAYHAILQKQSDDTAHTSGDEDHFEAILDKQRSVVATMQVKQAQQYAELWKKSMVVMAQDVSG